MEVKSVLPIAETSAFLFSIFGISSYRYHTSKHKKNGLDDRFISFKNTMANWQGVHTTIVGELNSGSKVQLTNDR